MIKNIIKTLSLTTVLISGHFLTGCTSVEPSAQLTPAQLEKSNKGPMVEYFADDALGNALAVVQQPAGIHQNGITYVTYQGPLEDPYVASYNHKTDEWQGPFKAGVSTMGKDPSRKKIDNHGKPTMMIDNAGYIHVFFGGHGGVPEHGKNPLGNIHYGENKHVVSKKPFDITSWEELDTIPPFGTYNQAVKMDNGDMYLFYRHGAHRSDWVYQKSTDNGRSFDAPVSFLKHKRRDDLKAVDSWYAWVGRGEGDDIIVGYDYHLCWDGGAGVNGRGHTTERHDVYYMAMDTKTGQWRNIKNEPLPMPLTREQADIKTLAASTGKEWTFNGSVHLDDKGYPHIATNAGVDIGLKTGGPKQTVHYRWDGKKWIGGNAVTGVESRGDFKVGSPNNIRYLLGYKDGSDGVIAFWHSHNGGKSFSKQKEVLRKPKAGWALTSLIKDAHPDAQMIVAEKPRGTNWRRIYLVGENGPIKRLKADAKVLKP